MTARERMDALFRDGSCPEPVVCLHTWGRYPFQVLGLDHRYCRSGGGLLADVYEKFLDAFPNDWLHVREELTPKDLWGAPPGPGDPDDPLPLPQPPPASPRSIFDVEADYRKEVFDAPGAYEHVSVLARGAGRRHMIFPNQGAPGSGYPGLGFEDQLVLVHERPDLVRRAVELDCTAFLTRVRAARDCGADGYILSEGYAGACDLISPTCFREVFLEPKRAFYRALREMDILGIGYFLGNVVPYLDTIVAMDPDGVMIEESKKGFTLDPARIRAALPPRMVLFGNLDSYLLLRGSSTEIRHEVRTQARATEAGPFVHCNGSPICPGTPPENLRHFLACARDGG